MVDGKPWLSVWAKTHRNQTGQVDGWLPLHQHLADAAGVATLLVDRWASPLVLRRIARELGGDIDDVRTLAGWLAAVHDVGKASPAFAVQEDTLADAMRRRGLVVSPALRHDPQRSRVRHEYLGQHTVTEFLIDEVGFRRRGAARQLGAVVGAHHGLPPTHSELKLAALGRPDLAGAGAWAQARTAVLHWATDLIGGAKALEPYAGCRIGKPTQALLTALVIMADWIASNGEYFPLDPLHTVHDEPRHPDPDVTAARVAHGWRQLALPVRWVPQPIGDPQVAITARFARPEARPVQIAAVQVAQQQDVPGLVIVEAPMGEGKTEAALLAAEVLAARSGADGCFVALPTRATTDAMFPRVLDWMNALPGLPAGTSVTLAHGTASLNDRYAGLLREGHEGSISCVGDEAGGKDAQSDEAAIAHFWLRGRKKGALAQFVIGTIDQVLFGGLKSRHLMLRHLALAGKVVVIDEVHAYDIFMSRYLDRVLHWLGAYGTPVVLLSATLPAARRAELLRAYDSGRGETSPTPGTGLGYPVVLGSGIAPRPVPASSSPRPVVLERLDDDLDSLVALLRENLADGGCAVVIRNTVARVQESAERLTIEFGEENVTVNHSRYLACDRAAIDQELLRRFGPPGPATDRPPLHIVVASQVVEQSLDVDFDLMVTDLAPIDLVLQRIGRLHRHSRPRPASLAQARCVLVGVEDWAGEPARAVSGSRRVYGEHALLRAAALLLDRDVITVPADIAPLVQAAYDDAPLGPDAWQPGMDDARVAAERAAAERAERAEDFLLGETGSATDVLIGWVRAGVGDAESDPRAVGQVRDGAENLEVLVVQRDRDGGLLTPDWIRDGAALQIPLDAQVPSWLARIIAACALRLPFALSHNGIVDTMIAALEPNRYPSFDQSPLLKGQLVLVLDEDRTAELTVGDKTVRLTYDLRRGLLHEFC